MELKEIQQIQLACHLIESGLRLSLISSLSGIYNKRLLRGLWKEIHGSRPASGKLPESVVSYINDFHSAAEMASFVEIYQQIHEQKVSNTQGVVAAMNALVLLEAMKEFVMLWKSDIDINAGYYAVRDVLFGNVLYTQCISCNAGFLYDPAKRYTDKCPYCKTLHLG